LVMLIVVPLSIILMDILRSASKMKEYRFDSLDGLVLFMDEHLQNPKKWLLITTDEMGIKVIVVKEL